MNRRILHIQECLEMSQYCSWYNHVETLANDEHQPAQLDLQYNQVIFHLVSL